MHVGTFASATFKVQEALESIDERKKMKKLSLLNTKTLFSVILLGLLGCVSTGCGTSSLSDVKEVPEVNGTVLLPTGKPLKGGQLIFRPVGGVKGSRKMYADINDDGTFVMKSDSQKQKIVASEYKVFVSLNGDPKYQSFRRLVPEKYRDVREDEYETDLFVNLNEQTSGIVLKMKKG